MSHKGDSFTEKKGIPKLMERGRKSKRRESICNRNLRRKLRPKCKRYGRSSY